MKREQSLRQTIEWETEKAAVTEQEARIEVAGQTGRAAPIGLVVQDGKHPFF